MANLDTTSKRRSSAQLLVRALLHPPLADGALTVGDRGHMIHVYSGITPTGAVELDKLIMWIQDDVG